VFESILKIGESLRAYSGEDIPIEQVREGSGLKIIFNLDNHILDCEIFECKRDKAKEKAKEFMWIGNPRGNTPQLRLTTNNPEYLLNPKKKYKWGIGAILKYIEERGLSNDNEIGKLYRYLEKLKELFFINGEDLTPKLKEKNISLKEITLCTISVEEGGRIIDLAKEPGYVKLLQHIIRYEKTFKYPLKRGKCHICGKEGEVLINPDYPKGTFLGIYVIDKIGFLSGVSRSESSLLKTHTVCFDCKEKLVLGMNYVNKHLSTRIGNLTAWIVPTILRGEINPNVITYCKEAFEVANSYDGFEKIREVEERFELLSRRSTISPYIVNIIFGRPQQSQFIFQALIPDVPVTRFIQIGRISEELARKMSKHFPYLADGVRRWFIGFKEISNLFPLTKVNGDVRGKPLIELFNAMLRGTYYPKEHLLKRALLYVRIHRFGNYGGYNILEVNKEGREKEICRGILLYNLLLSILVELRVIEMEEREPLVLEGVDKDIADFCRDQGYSEWQTGLFLLGVLIGAIGIEQFKKGDKKKSILDKIDFDGMSVEKIKWLANVIVEGLRNYRILEFNETTYAQAKKLVDKNIDRLKNPLDNTFYVLSGYAYSTFRAITGGGKYEQVTE
jgi:CRISPR-associated protein Csh1